MSNMLDVRFLEVSPVNNPEQSIDQGNEQGNDPGILGLLFDEISHGVLVVNPQGRVTHSNRAARDAMANCGVLYTQQGELTALSPIDAKLLYAALIRASAGVRRMVKLSGSGTCRSMKRCWMRGLRFMPRHVMPTQIVGLVRPAIGAESRKFTSTRKHKRNSINQYN